MPQSTLSPLQQLRETGARHPLTPGKADRTVLGFGVDLNAPQAEGYLCIRDAERSGHFGCFGTTRVGKAQNLDALVLTPKGFRRMGDILPGDLVSTPDGGCTRVLEVFPQGVLPMYRISFEDGRSVLASGDHLWEIHHKHWNGKYRPGQSRAGRARPRVLTTLELHAHMARNKGRFHVRLAKPVEQPQQELPLHPYVLGCILGDGLIGKGNRMTFCNPDVDIIERMRARMPDTVDLRHVGPRPIDYAFAIRERARLDTTHLRGRNGKPAHPMKLIVERLGLSGTRSREKHVPEIYKASTTEDRLELLRGLLDTDGTVTKTGVVQFDTTSERLAQDVQELVWSLGGVATIKKKQAGYRDAGVKKPGRMSYHLTIQHPTPRTLLTLPRKRDRAPSHYRYGSDGLKLQVTSIEPAGEADAQCLLLDHPNHLYITDHYIVTHNTRLIENLIEQDIAKGYSVIVFDPKGDVELFSRIVQTAAQTNRLDDLMMLTPIFPEQSIRINPLASYYMEDELVNHIISGIKAKEDYFISIAMEVSQVVVAGLIRLARARGEEPRLNFNDIKQRIGFNDLRSLRESLAMLPGCDQVCNSIDQIIQAPSMADFFSKVSSSLRTTLSALTFGTTGLVLGSAQTNEMITRLEQGRPVIMFCNTGSMLTRRTSHIIGKVMLSMIQSLVGRVFASGRKLTPPLCLHMDEGHNLLYQDIQELFSKGGGANCWVHFYSQSMAQIAEAIGPDAAQSLMDNINTWVYMLVNHPDTADYIERSSPQVTRREGVVAIGGGISSRTTDNPQVPAHRVLQLPKRWFYLRSYGKLCKGRTLDTNPLWVKVQFPHLDPGSVSERPEPSEQPAPAEVMAGVGGGQP